MIRAILTDIEGTVGSISFVREVLFPYARAALPTFVREHGQESGVRRWLDQVASETGAGNDEAIITVLQQWTDEDRKHTALKALQGLIWQDGYRQNAYKAPIYADAATALRQWRQEDIPLYVYSSGSVPAQKLFFGHSDAGDLTSLFCGWFDTEVGGKREAASYTRIATDIGIPAPEILFLSDVVEELDAARDAGMRTMLLDRRADYPQPRHGNAANDHATVESFDWIKA
ncbi:MAG: acireductone synthase [Xanthomonadaceae bacterium]|jgi:enolase-phosphatase E1|nr:acireductone synthase [Xanthomonadaceae bacterium]